jgi:hypothetical protein
MTQETSGANRFQMRFRSICPLIVILILAVVFDSGAHLLLAASDHRSVDQPVEGQGMYAVAIIFSLDVGGHGIDINTTASPPWSEARIKNTFIGKDLYLRRNSDERCRFDLGFTVMDKDGMPSMGKLFASIRFDRLSREYETRTSPIPDFYNITVHGLPGAVCERDRCFADFNSGALLAPQLRQMTRALKFVFDHVCSPVEFPLEKQ